MKGCGHCSLNESPLMFHSTKSEESLRGGLRYRRKSLHITHTLFADILTNETQALDRFSQIAAAISYTKATSLENAICLIQLGLFHCEFRFAWVGIIAICRAI